MESAARLDAAVASHGGERPSRRVAGQFEHGNNAEPRADEDADQVFVSITGCVFPRADVKPLRDPTVEHDCCFGVTVVVYLGLELWSVQSQPGYTSSPSRANSVAASPWGSMIVTPVGEVDPRATSAAGASSSPIVFVIIRSGRSRPALIRSNIGG